MDVAADAEEDVPPMGWTWRGRRYRVTSVLEHWVETGEWWLRDDGQFPRVRFWRLEAASNHGQGVVEIAHDSSEDAWRIVGVLD
ncbi:DUF6504 family protein [Spirillospora sp. CA-294931]|uniref:DUF6504 family protein n=1 Tax=Spirillospora sp. CA-294931 TaxID=3240042 RepID=UPI003D94C34F